MRRSAFGCLTFKSLVLLGVRFIDLGVMLACVKFDNFVNDHQSLLRLPLRFRCIK